MGAKAPDPRPSNIRPPLRPPPPPPPRKPTGTGPLGRAGVRVSSTVKEDYERGFVGKPEPPKTIESIRGNWRGETDASPQTCYHGPFDLERVLPFMYGLVIGIATAAILIRVLVLASAP